MKIRTTLLLAILLLTAVIAADPATRAAEDPVPEKLSATVLYLNSYHDGYAWSDSILNGAREVLKSPDLNIDLQIEYLDTKKYDYETIKDTLFTLYSDKFEYDYYDAVIVSDNGALNFILEYGEELFPGVPVVFTGVNDFDPKLIQGRNITGVVEDFDIEKTIDIALSLHPERTRFVAIGDESTTGVAIRNQVKRAVPKYADRLKFEFWSSMDLAEILDRVRRDSDDVIYYLIPFHQSVMGEFYNTQDILYATSSVSNAPFYSNWQFLLGHGIVGGSLLSGTRHGHEAAEMVLRLLRGETIASIPVVTHTEPTIGFDYNILKRFNIDEDRLPEGSVIINEPAAFYELDKQVFWTIIIGLLALTVFTVFLSRNILQRKRVEQQLKQQLRFLAILMDTLPLHVSWKDMDQRYLGANRTFTDFFGIKPPESIIGLTDENVLADLDFAAWNLEVEREVIGTGVPLRGLRCNVENAQKSTVCLEVSKVPLRDGRGRIIGALTTAEDVTLRIDLERQLLQSQKMEAIGTLAGGIAHDFNNILTSIINSAELALMDMDDEDMGHADISRVLKAARRGARLVTQILTFSRPSREGFQPVNLSSIVREDMELIKASMPANISISLELPDPDDKFPDLCLGNPGQLHQVVMNLCTNSYQAMYESGGTLTVSLTPVEVDADRAQSLDVLPGSYLRLIIADTGPGIAEEILHKIFDPFFTTKGKTEGTGLGLAVVHGIIKAHGGAIGVLSEPDRGAQFELLLPRAAESAPLPASAGEQALRGAERILFVEDDLDQLASVPRVLESLGYTVIARPGGQEALDEFWAEPETFDLIITDYDMPGLNGLELAQSVAKIRPATPILLISGRRQALEAAQQSENIRQVLLKPYNKVLLSEAVRAVIEADDLDTDIGIIQ